MAIGEFLEPAVKDYAEQAKATYSAPIDTSTFAQQIAGMDPMQTKAADMATKGVGSYEPFLLQAQAAQQQGAGALGNAATAVGGLGAIQNQAAGMTGANAYQPFMSPYQQQVIDATMSEYDKSRLGGQQQIRDQAVASGNFGGGREGAMMGQYNADSLVNRGALQSQMLQQGFGQAQQQAQQGFQNQGALFGMQNQQNLSNQGLAGAYGNQMNQQFGLSDFGRTGMGQDINALGSLGALNQGQAQAQLNATQQNEQTAAYEPYGRLSQYGNTLTGLAGGVAGNQYQQQGQSSPFQTALGTAMGLGGLYGKIFNN
jgi:hypothetical protein